MKETAVHPVSAEDAKTEVQPDPESFGSAPDQDDIFGSFLDVDQDGDDFLSQFGDDEVPDDLLAPTSHATDYRRSTPRQKENADRAEAKRPNINGADRDSSPDWEELEKDPLAHPIRDPKPSANRSPNKQSRTGELERTRRSGQRAQKTRSSSQASSKNSRSLLIPAAFLVVLIAIGVGVGIFLSLAGESESTAPAVDYEEAAKAEVEELLSEVDDPKPATTDGTPTISPRAITLALAEGGWRVSSMEENDLGSLKSTSMMVTRGDMAASLTIYRTKSTNMAEELLAETRSPSEGITFGSTLVRISPGPSRNKSGVTPVVALLYEFKSMAREAAAEARGEGK